MRALAPKENKLRFRLATTGVGDSPDEESAKDTLFQGQAASVNADGHGAVVD
jgi:hypothetical protein